jgi:PAS domain S-box-containing protein
MFKKFLLFTVILLLMVGFQLSSAQAKTDVPDTGSNLRSSEFSGVSHNIPTTNHPVTSDSMFLMQAAIPVGLNLYLKVALMMLVGFNLWFLPGGMRKKKQKEDSLDGSDKGLQDILDNTPNAILIHCGYRITYVNNEAVRNLGASTRDELIGSDIFRIIPPDYHEVIKKRIAELYDRKIPASPLELNIIRLDGSSIDVEVFGTAIDFDNKPAALINFRDISDRKRSLRNLQIQHNLAMKLSASRNMNEVLEMSLDAALGLCRMEMGSIYLLDEATGDLVLATHRGHNDDFINKSMRHKNNSPQVAYALSGIAVFGGLEEIGDAEKGFFKCEKLRNVVLFPIHHKGQLLALISLASLKSLDISESTKNILETMVGLMGLEISNARANENLKESEAKWRSVIENIPGFITIVDADFKIQFINRSILDMSASEFQKRDVREFLKPEYRETAGKMLEKVFRTGVPASYEAEGAGLDGTYLWFETQIGPIYQDDKVVSAILISSDITTRKLAEDALRESEEKYRRIVHASPMGIHMYKLESDSSLVFEGSNPAADKILGVQNSQFMGKTIEEAFPPLANTEVSRKYEEVARNGVLWHTQQINYEYEEISGAYEVYAFQTSQDHMVAMFLDITERKKTELALKESEAKLQTIFKAAPMGIGFVDKTRTLGWTNERMSMILGYSEDELFGMQALNLYESKEEYERVGREKHADVRMKGVGTIETRMKRKGGELVDIILSSAQVDPDNFEAGLIFTVTDIGTLKKAQEELSKTQALLKAAIEQSPSGIIIADITTFKAQFVNGVVMHMLGYRTLDIDSASPEDMMKTWAGYDISGNLLKLDELPIVRSMITGQVIANMEMKIVRKVDGREFDILSNSAPIFNTNGEIIAGISVFHDITERKKTEEELIRTRAFLSAAIEQTPAGVIIADAPDVKIRIANSAALGVRGDSVDPLLEIPYEIHPERWQTFYPDGTPYEGKDLPLSQAVLEGKTVKNVELIIKRSDGEPRWVLANAAPVHDRTGKVIAGIVVFPDITDLKMAEKALRKSEEQYRNLIENSPYAIVIHCDEKAVYVNRRAAELAGVETGSDIIGREIWDFVHPDFHAFARERFKALYRGEILSNIVEYTFFKADGTLVQVELMDTLIEYEGKSAIQASFMDISERKSTEVELEKYREHLEDLVKERTLELEQAQEELVKREKLATLGHLVAVVSHEIRNPLGTIASSIFTMKQKLQNLQVYDSVEKQFDRVERSIRRCDAIIEELLEYRRGSEPEIKKTFADQWLNEVLDDLVITAEIAVTRNFNAPSEVCFDREKLRRCIINVITNAAQAIDDKRLRLSNLTEYIPQISVTTRIDKNRLWIEVEDNGVGIKDDDLKQIFEPLFSTKSFGVGLGLSIVRQILDQHHGDIEIKSSMNEGTSVKMWIPVE